MENQSKAKSTSRLLHWYTYVHRQELEPAASMNTTRCSWHVKIIQVTAASIQNAILGHRGSHYIYQFVLKNYSSIGLQSEAEPYMRGGLLSMVEHSPRPKDPLTSAVVSRAHRNSCSLDVSFMVTTSLEPAAAMI